MAFSSIAVYKFPVFAPVLYSKNPEVNVGTVQKKQVVHSSFKVYNLHPYPVTVKTVIGTCGCMEVTPGKTMPYTLKPFESVDVNSSIESPDKEGTFHKTIRVITTDNPKGTSLVVSGLVK